MLRAFGLMLRFDDLGIEEPRRETVGVSRSQQFAAT